MSDDVLAAYNMDGQPIQGQPGSNVTVTFDDIRKHKLVLGATGAGKTAGVALPVLQRFIESGRGGLLIDVKGKLRSAVQQHFNIRSDRFCWIGPSPEARSVNLLSGFTASEFGDFLRSVSNAAQKNDNKTFTERGVEMVEFLFRTIELIRGQTPTIDELKETLNNPGDLMAEIHEVLASNPELPETYRFLTDTIDELRNGGHQYHILRMTDYFDMDGNDSEIRKQIGYYRASVLPYLKRFTDDETVRRTICASKPINLREAVYERDQIVILDIPARSSASVLTQKLIRSHFQDVVFDEKYGQDQSPDKETFTLIDDYQQVVSFDDYLDDNHWLDICRGLDHGVVALTQSFSSLMGEVPQNKHRVMTLAQNFRTKVFLPTSDNRTLDLVRMLTERSGTDNGGTIGFSSESTDSAEPCFAVRRLLYPQNKGEGLIYKGTLSESGDKTYFGPIRTGAVDGHEYMGRFINAEPESTPTPDESTEQAGSFEHGYNDEQLKRMLGRSAARQRRKRDRHSPDESAAENGSSDQTNDPSDHKAETDSKKEPDGSIAQEALREALKDVEERTDDD